MQTKSPAGRAKALIPAGFGLIELLSCWALLGALASAEVSPFQAARTPASKTPVILITIDTLRADRLTCYGYAKGKTANIDSLAAEGVLFENVYAQTPITLPSHATILTGTYPMYHKVQDVVGRLRDGVPTL